MFYPTYWPKEGWVSKSGWEAQVRHEDVRKHDQSVRNYFAEQFAEERTRGGVATTPQDVLAAIHSSTAGDDDLWEELTFTHGTVKVYSLPPETAWFKGIVQLINQSVKAQPAQAFRFEPARGVKAMSEGKFVSWMKDEIRNPLVVGPGSVVVDKIQIIKNPTLWQRYTQHRTSVATKLGLSRVNVLEKVKWTTTGRPVPVPGQPFGLPVLTPNLGECLLFHGTSKFVSKIIAHDGFDPQRGKGEPRLAGGYGALGLGTYMSDAFAKVATYTTCPKCGTTARCGCQRKSGGPTCRKAFLSRVVLANLALTTRKDRTRCETPHTAGPAVQAVDPRTRRPIGPPVRPDSVLGQSDLIFNTSSQFDINEFLVTNRDQIYPEFLISFHFG